MSRSVTAYSTLCFAMTLVFVAGTFAADDEPAHLRKSRRRRLPLQLRAGQRADFLPHGRRSGHRAAQGRVLPVHDAGGWLLALDQSARLELHHAEPLAFRERRGAGGHFGWRSTDPDAFHHATRPVAGVARSGARPVGFPDAPPAGAARRRVRRIGSASWAAGIRATRNPRMSSRGRGIPRCSRTTTAAGISTGDRPTSFRSTASSSTCAKPTRSSAFATSAIRAP